MAVRELGGVRGAGCVNFWWKLTQKWFQNSRELGGWVWKAVEFSGCDHTCWYDVEGLGGVLEQYWSVGVGILARCGSAKKRNPQEKIFNVVLKLGYMEAVGGVFPWG